jgi:hypothetical protein
MGRRSGGSDEDNVIGAADPPPPNRRPVSPPHGQGRTWTGGGGGGGGGGGQYPRMENGGTGLEERWPGILFAKFKLFYIFLSSFVNFLQNVQLDINYERNLTAKRQQRKFETNIPRKGIARCLSPNLHIHVSVSDLYIPTIGLPILLAWILGI